MQFVFSLGGVQCSCTFQELKLETNIWKLKQTFSKLVLVFPNETVPLLNLCKFDINRLLLHCFKSLLFHFCLTKSVRQLA